MQRAILQIEQHTISFMFLNEYQTEYKAGQSMDLPFQVISAHKYIPIHHSVFHESYILEFSNCIIISYLIPLEVKFISAGLRMNGLCQVWRPNFCYQLFSSVSLCSTQFVIFLFFIFFVFHIFDNEIFEWNLPSEETKPLLWTPIHFTLSPAFFSIFIFCIFCIFCTFVFLVVDFHIFEWG